MTDGLNTKSHDNITIREFVVWVKIWMMEGKVDGNSVHDICAFMKRENFIDKASYDAWSTWLSPDPRDEIIPYVKM